MYPLVTKESRNSSKVNNYDCIIVNEGYLELQNHFYDDLIFLILSYASLSSLDVLEFYPDLHLWNDYHSQKIYDVYFAEKLICWGFCPYVEQQDPFDFYRIYPQGKEDLKHNMSYEHSHFKFDFYQKKYQKKCNFDTLLIEIVKSFYLSYTTENSFEYASCSSWYLVENDPSDYPYYSFVHSHAFLFPIQWWQIVFRSFPNRFRFASEYDKELYGFFFDKRKMLLRQKRKHRQVKENSLEAYGQKIVTQSFYWKEH